MKYPGVLFSVLILAAGCTPAPPAAPDVRAEVQGIYDEIGRAVERKDLAGVTRFSLPTATVRYADGTEFTLPEWKERAQKGWTGIKATRSQFTVTDVKVEGDSAEASYTEAHEMTVAGPKDAQDHAIGYEAEWRATLARTEAGWRLKRSVEVKRRVTRDGMLIDEQPKP